MVTGLGTVAVMMAVSAAEMMLMTVMPFVRVSVTVATTMKVLRALSDFFSRGFLVRRASPDPSHPVNTGLDWLNNSVSKFAPIL